MFDKEVVKRKLRELVITDLSGDVDLDKVVDNYEVVDGFYVFRIGENGHIFQNNNFIESCPGLYATERGGESGGH